MKSMLMELLVFLACVSWINCETTIPTTTETPLTTTLSFSDIIFPVNNETEERKVSSSQPMPEITFKDILKDYEKEKMKNIQKPVESKDSFDINFPDSDKSRRKNRPEKDRTVFIEPSSLQGYNQNLMPEEYEGSNFIEDDIDIEDLLRDEMHSSPLTLPPFSNLRGYSQHPMDSSSQLFPIFQPNHMSFNDLDNLELIPQSTVQPFQSSFSETKFPGFYPYIPHFDTQMEASTNYNFPPYAYPPLLESSPYAYTLHSKVTPYNVGYRSRSERVFISPYLYSRPCKYDCFAGPLKDMKYGFLNMLEGSHNHGR